MARDYQLELLQTQLEDLEQDYETVKEQLRNELDGPTQNKLKRQLDEILQDIKQREQEINARQQANQRQSVQASLEALIAILTGYEDQLGTIIQAYQQTIIHWPAAVNPNAGTVDAILNELEKIALGQSLYTAQSEFIAHLVYATSAPGLSSALIQWGQQYREGIDWLQLHAQIQAAQDKRLENAQPAILLTITRSDEASTQSQERETYYQLNAWLIEDIETYQAHKTGYHPLVSTDSPDAQPCLLEDLLQKITRLLNHFLTEKNRICKYCENYPQIHVFLPLELMHLGVDVWQLKPPTGRRSAECLGHDHVVVLRCANRYEGTYTKAPGWRKLWKRHQSVLAKPASDVFVPGHDEDLDELVDILEAVQSEGKIVGLHVTQAPVDIKELCHELLVSGLPLAVWRRRDLGESAKGSDWSTLLTQCCLEQLPNTVKQERYKARRKSENDHMGHHLSLLWDDPHLVPPKSA